MGLLTIPKKYNPPGNGKRDMEYPIFATKAEQGLLKARGGAGKMTRHGLLSFGLGDKGNSLGSAGGSNWAGNGKGGQVNLDSVGGKTGNVLRNVYGEWKVVSKNPQPQQASVSRAPVQLSPAIPPPAQTLQAPMAAQPIALDPQIAGRLQSALASKAASVASTMATKSAREDALAGATNQAPALGMGGVRGSWTNPGNSSVALDPSINGRNEQARRNEMTGIGGGVQGGQGIVGFESGPAPSLGYQAPQSSRFQDPAAIEARAKAVSRGPGSVAGVMPGASALSQQRTMQTLGNAMTEGGFPMSSADVQNLSKTVFGEAGRESPMGQTAVANTMLNRMSLAASDPSKYGYMGGTDIKSLMGQFDATGPARAGGVPNKAFQNAQPGTDALGQGIASLAGAASPNSMFNTMAPASIKNATHFYNPETSNPRWGGSGFTDLGNHTFGNAEPTATQVASLRSNPSQGGPTQVASIGPTAGPVGTISDAPTGSWMDALPGASLAKAAYTAVDENLVKPTQEQVNKYGGFKRAGQLAQMAVGIMNFMPSLSPGKFGPGGGGQGNTVGSDYSNKSPAAPSITPLLPTPVTPPVNPAAPQLVYPQYTQTWANLPTGSYGIPWKPTPPSEGLFKTDTGKKKKKGAYA